MTAEQTLMTKNRWVWIVPAAVAVLVISRAIHILYMVAYYHFIDPGQETAHYHAHAELSAPYASIFVGTPLMFLVCRWIGKKFAASFSVTAALLVWLVYFLIDITVLVFTEEFSQSALLFVIAFVTKLAAAYLGGLAARKQVVETVE